MDAQGPEYMRGSRKTRASRRRLPTAEGLRDPDANQYMKPTQDTYPAKKDQKRSKIWTEAEEIKFAVLLLVHGLRWEQISSKLEDRSPNTVRCKFYNDIRAVQTSYKNRRKEYNRLLFMVAFRMEEEGLRLEQLKAEDFRIALSPIDHPQIYAEYAKTLEAPEKAAEERSEAPPDPQSPLWSHLPGLQDPWDEESFFLPQWPPGDWE